MMDALSLAFTILLNPPLLLLLLVLYFAGKLIGRLSVRMNIWKFLLLAYLAIFLVQPLRDAGWFLGGIFLLGFFSNHIRRLPGILLWAESLEDIYFAYKHDNAYDDIRRREKEAEERLREERERAARQNTGNSSTQNAWRDEARRHRGQGSAQSDEQDRGRGRYGNSTHNDQARFKSHSKPSSGSSGSSIRETHLRTLGLKPGRDYSLQEIKKAYRERVKKTHPDKGGSSEELRAVISAWEWLKRNPI